MPLTADDLKRACRPNIKTVDIPGLGEVCIRAMTLRDRDSYEKASVDGGGKLPCDFRSQYLSRCLCDIDGTSLTVGAIHGGRHDRRRGIRDWRGVGH